MFENNGTKEEKMYAAFKAQQHYLHIEHINSLSLQFITEMLLCSKLQIQDFPFELRTSNRHYYVTAFRVSRNISQERLRNDIQLLQEDLKKDFPNKREFQKLLDLYIDWNETS